MAWRACFQRSSAAPAQRARQRAPLQPPNALGRAKGRLGQAEGIVAGAHTLALIIWHLLKFKEPFNPEVFAKEEAKMKRHKLARLQNLAASLNYQLVPNQ